MVHRLEIAGCSILRGRRNSVLHLFRNSLRCFADVPYRRCGHGHSQKKDSVYFTFSETSSTSLAARFVENSPAVLQPYLRLTRVDRPIGSWLLFWPGAWSIAIATSPGHLPDLKLLCLFGLGAFLMRGAGCIVNDLWDSDIDGRVSRTATRPLPSGQLSMTTAFLLVGVHGFTALPILLSLNTYSIWLGLACVLPTLVYPYMKRVTNWPQLYLGLVFNWGALLGYAAVQGYCDWSVVLPLYVSCVSWTVFYDTVYGHQDRDDDAKLGLKSTSISFANYTKPFLSVFLLAMTSGLTISGLQSAQTWPYHLAVVGSAAFLGKQVWSVNVNDRQQCGNMFRDSWWIGLLMFIGITISTLLKHDSVEKSGKVHENGNSSNGQ